MSLYKQFKTDKKCEKDGVELDFGDFSVNIARAGGANKAYLRASEKVHRKHRRALQAGTIGNDQANRIMMELYASTVVLSWENVKDENGEPLVCTRENIIKVFTDLPDFFRNVQDAAIDIALFRDAIEEADEKNS